MKYSLLQMVQRTLSSLGSDQVNSITDTTESDQIVDICEAVFYDMASELNLPEHNSVFQLQPSNDSTKPTIMYRPDTAHSIRWIKYNKATVDDPEENWYELTYLPLDDFLVIMNNLKTDDDNVVNFTHAIDVNNTLYLMARNDVGPTYFSTFDDNTIIFDSFDSLVDTTLQKSKTQAFGGTSKIFTRSDDFIPPFDEQVFALYLNEVKSLAWVELKEIPHGKAEQAAKRQRAALQRNRSAFETQKGLFDRFPNFGRK